jgi:hypothetical protein
MNNWANLAETRVNAVNPDLPFKSVATEFLPD